MESCLIVQVTKIIGCFYFCSFWIVGFSNKLIFKLMYLDIFHRHMLSKLRTITLTKGIVLRDTVKYSIFTDFLLDQR